MLFFRILIALLLVLPQGFAPLVHAHVGMDLSPDGPHLPGLESTAGSGDNKLLACSPGGSKGCVVSADHGVRQHTLLLPAPLLLSNHPPAKLPILKPGAIQSSPPDRYPLAFFYTHTFPRAPPV